MRRPSLVARPRPLPLPEGEGRGEGARRGAAAAIARPVPRGLTLVELLVAVGIIAMLVGLLTPTLMGARRTAMNAKVKSEIDLLHMALMNYKSEYGSFPPANFGPVPGVGPLWISDSVGVNTRHPVYRHLVRIFPRLAEAKNQAEVNALRSVANSTYPPTSPFQELSLLSPAQALVFWLRGFHENPEFPLTNAGRPGQRKKLFDFDQSRFYAATPYDWNTAQRFKSRSDATATQFEKDYPVYFTGQPSSGLPYVYFDSRCYDVQGNDLRYLAQSVGGEQSTATPYLTSEPPSTPLWSQQHVNADTFQLIASGLDGRYGAVQAAFPNGIDGTDFKSAGVVPGHVDNITNFAAKPLADAVSALNTDK